MKALFRHYGKVVALLAVLVALAVLLTALLGHTGDRSAARQMLVTTYPLYTAAQNVLGDMDAVKVTMLSGVGAGCLHDYQLSPADRLAARRADVVLVNGVGDQPLLAELGIEEKVYDASKGVELLCAEHHHHEEEHHHEEAYNDHIWVSPTRYKQQVMHTARALWPLLDSKQQVYCQQNTAAYLSAIDEVAAQMPSLEGRPCVLFHDSLSYLAQDMGLDAKLTFSADGESGLSAAQLAQVEQLTKEYPNLLLLYDTQYPIRYTAVEGLVAAEQVLALETAVVGTGKATDWLDAMERNAAKLQQVTEGGDAP